MMMAFVLELNLLASSSGSRNQSALVTFSFPDFYNTDQENFMALEVKKAHQLSEWTYKAQRYQHRLGPRHPNHRHIAVKERLDDDDLQRCLYFFYICEHVYEFLYESL